MRESASDGASDIAGKPEDSRVCPFATTREQSANRSFFALPNSAVSARTLKWSAGTTEVNEVANRGSGDDHAGEDGGLPSTLRHGRVRKQEHCTAENEQRLGLAIRALIGSCRRTQSLAWTWTSGQRVIARFASACTAWTIPINPIPLPMEMFCRKIRKTTSGET